MYYGEPCKLLDSGDNRPWPCELFKYFLIRKLPIASKLLLLNWLC